MPEETKAQEVSFTRSEGIGALVAAMCKAQLAFDPIYKESNNPAFKRKDAKGIERPSKYADLYSLVTATRKHLNANGLTIMQFPNVAVDGKVLEVTTLLAHESSEWISCKMSIPAVDERGFTAHSIGKAMTYARRYSWQAVTGSIAEDDDDGNEVSGQGTSEAAFAKGQEKIDELKKKTAPSASQSVPSLFYALQPSGMYAIQGDEELMRKMYPQWKKYFLLQDKCYMVGEEMLEQAKIQCESAGIPFSVLKAGK